VGASLEITEIHAGEKRLVQLRPRVGPRDLAGTFAARATHKLQRQRALLRRRHAAESDALSTIKPRGIVGGTAAERARRGEFRLLDHEGVVH